MTLFYFICDTFYQVRKMGKYNGLTRTIRFKSIEQKEKFTKHINKLDTNVNAWFQKCMKIEMNGGVKNRELQDIIDRANNKSTKFELEMLEIRKKIEKHNKNVVNILKEAVPLIMKDAKAGAGLLAKRMKEFLVVVD